jgi:NAD+ synthase (glutamine-hydrolysing)
MKNNELTISIAQANLLVGDIAGNAAKITEWSLRARDAGSRLIVFPELTLTGYPPEDLLLRPSLAFRIETALSRLLETLPSGIAVILGYPRARGGELYNAAGVLFDGKMVAEYFKQELPNYLVFDEKRYFKAGNEPCVFDFQGVRIALTVCEDIWHPGPLDKAASLRPDLVINLNASPFHRGKGIERLDVVATRVRHHAIPVIYANLVGGQDELVFDGASFAIDADGRCVLQAPSFEECLVSVQFDRTLPGLLGGSGVTSAPSDDVATVYQALVLGVRDYVNKNGFRGAVLGLSGGIDSALTLAIAVDALGADRVEAVMMPFKYTSTMSLEDAEAQARVLGVHYHVRPIEAPFNAFMQVLQVDFAGTLVDKTEENLQARCRGVLLMALSNKKGYLVLTTGNKSEMAVGYATLYGDMAGGFDVLKDVPKTLVFRLARYRNAMTPEAPPIPERVIERPPSAELAPDQKDEDSLPPYAALDAILERYIEEDQSAADIVAAGFDQATVERVIRMVDLNEYKRRQAPIGPRITTRGFGRDRRYPVTCRWPAGE